VPDPSDKATDVIVRLAEPHDLDALLVLLRDCVSEMQARGLDQWDDIYPDRTTLLGDIQSRTLYLAARDGAAPLLAALTLNQRQDPEYADVAWAIAVEPVAVVHRLMVHPTAQRGGLGRFLMRFAERQAHRLGCRAIRLDTMDANTRALAFYRALGYRQAGAVRFRKGAFTCFERRVSGPEPESQPNDEPEARS
jgi:ribosomal protein S18 acetylase RimI-like enzyme